MLLKKFIALADTELKFASDKTGVFEGYGSTFNNVDTYADLILPGAYKGVVKAAKRDKRLMPKMFYNHKSFDLPIGKWEEMFEDDTGLKLAGAFTPGNIEAAQVEAGLKHGTIDGLSIGYGLTASDWSVKEVDGRPVRHIKNVSRLAEVSVVTYPADGFARVDMESVKAELSAVTNIREFEDFLREAGGFSKSLATATASLAKKVFGASESTGEPLALPDDLRKAIAKNLSSARTL